MACSGIVRIKKNFLPRCKLLQVTFLLEVCVCLCVFTSSFECLCSWVSFCLYCFGRAVSTVISLGFVVSMLICLPFGYLNLVSSTDSVSPCTFRSEISDLILMQCMPMNIFLIVICYLCLHHSCNCCVDQCNITIAFSAVRPLSCACPTQDDNMWFQWFSLVGLILFTLEFVVQFFLNMIPSSEYYIGPHFDPDVGFNRTGLGPALLPVFKVGGQVSAARDLLCFMDLLMQCQICLLIGLHLCIISCLSQLTRFLFYWTCVCVCLFFQGYVFGLATFAYSYIVTIPSWVNEKKAEVNFL